MLFRSLVDKELEERLEQPHSRQEDAGREGHHAADLIDGLAWVVIGVA